MDAGTNGRDVVKRGEICTDSMPAELQHGSTLHRDPEYEKRLSTYGHWSYKKSRTLLAGAGFQYTGIADKVECPSCGIKLYNWQEKEDPLKAHKQYAPDCEFMKTYYPEVPATPRPKEVLSVKYPQYSTYEARLRTFNNGWPLKCVAQRPDMMARSGFYYIGSADRARCFHCGVTLRDWDTDDYPPSSHKQWSQACPFVITLDVPALRNEIEELERTELMRIEFERSTFVDCSSSKSKINNSSERFAQELVVDGASSDREGFVNEDCVTPQVHSQVSDKSNDDLALSPAVLAVIEFGHSMEKISKVIAQRRRAGHYEIPSAIELYQLVEDFP